jgi:hypothetical protein
MILNPISPHFQHTTINRDHYMTLSRADHPTLQKLLDEGVVTITDGEYCGKAADGVFVGFGPVGCEDQVERYLSNRPNPNDW